MVQLLFILFVLLSPLDNLQFGSAPMHRCSGTHTLYLPTPA